MKIASDIDGVIADFCTTFLHSYVNPFLMNKGQAQLRVKDLVKFRFSESAKLSEEEMDNIFTKAENDEIYLHLNTTNDGFVEAMRVLSMHNDVYYITNRERVSPMMTYRWFRNNKIPFGNGIYFAGHDDKPDICEMLGIEVMIEDHFFNAVDVSAVVKKSFLVDRPWNRQVREGVVLPTNMEVIKYGKQLEDYVLGETRAQRLRDIDPNTEYRGQ